MNIAITGAKGFIGQEVVKQLKDKGDVNLKLLDENTHSLLDSASLKSFVEDQNVIIHLAGLNRDTNFALVQVNALGTLSLLEAVSQYAPKTRIVFASTFQVYLPQSLYGLSKKFAEELLTQYGLNKNIQSTILRLANVYGPGGKPFYNSVIATFAHQINLGETLNVNGDGSSERDYVYLEDVAQAFVKAAQYNQKEKTEIIDICSGASTTLKEVVDILGESSSKKVDVVYNNAVQDKPWPTKDKNFDKAKKLLGWEPKTTLKQGLEKVMQ